MVGDNKNYSEKTLLVTEQLLAKLPIYHSLKSSKAHLQRNRTGVKLKNINVRLFFSVTAEAK